MSTGTLQEKKTAWVVITVSVALMVLVLGGTVYVSYHREVAKQTVDAATFLETQKTENVQKIAESQIPPSFVLGQRGLGFEIKESSAQEANGVVTSHLVFLSAVGVNDLIGLYEDYFKTYMRDAPIHKTALAVRGWMITVVPKEGARLIVSIEPNSAGPGSLATLEYAAPKGASWGQVVKNANSFVTPLGVSAYLDMQEAFFRKQHPDASIQRTMSDDGRLGSLIEFPSPYLKTTIQVEPAASGTGSLVSVSNEHAQY